MRKWKKGLLAGLVIACLSVLLMACEDADVASYNVSKDADNFKVIRKVTFINTVTDKVLYTVEGNMAIKADTEDNQLEITAKTGKDQYQKHFLSMSPTTVYIVEQMEWHKASQYHFKITMKPSALIPDIEKR